jgi:hypothetical protein
MNPLLPLFAPLAVLLPGMTGAELARDLPRDPETVEAEQSAPMTPDQAAAEHYAPGGQNYVLFGGYRPTVQNQVSIEQRVTIRVAPRAPSTPILFDRLPANGAGPRFTERKMSKCVPVAGIVGVQYRDANRLVLYLRDRRMVSATLEKTCSARDYYSGFYVARNGDGQLCVDRDAIRSRSGANCQISAMRQLVEVGD